VPTLVTDEVKPRFHAKLVGNPMQTLWVHRHQTVMAVTENGTPDAFPPFRLFAPIVAIAAQNPDDLISAPSGDKVAGEPN